MYEELENALETILKAVGKCPEPLQPKCFEILLQGFVDQQLAATRPTHQVAPQAPLPPAPPPSDIPPEMLPRLKTMAKRLSLELSAIEKLFDFSSDPVAFHAFSVPGENNAEKTRRVALLVAAKSYMATGSWSADWKDVKARCVDQNCYDVSNFTKFLKKGEGEIFKSIDTGKSVELSSSGVTEAEGLIKTIASEP